MTYTPFITSALVLGMKRPKCYALVKGAIRNGGHLPESYEDFFDWYRKHIGNDVPDRSDWDACLSKFEDHQRASIAQIDLASPSYPKWLSQIIDPPPVLFARGNFEKLSTIRGLAVVGTRDASKAGLEIARRIGEHFAIRGWAIISGLALGIDASAHRGALDGKGCTVAVLANGLHEASPKSNARLADEILECGGLWVSEHPIGATPRKEFFVARNRIQIGLSAGSVIVEAALRSGSMAQANFCVREKRKLFAVLPQTAENPLGLNCTGTQDMVLRLGATPIVTRSDYPVVEMQLEESEIKLNNQ
jgi:DNA processing protein